MPDDIVFLSNNLSIANLKQMTNMSRIYELKTKVMSALIMGKQRQTVLTNGGPLEEIKKFTYLRSMSIPNGQVAEEIGRRAIPSLGVA